MPDDYLSIDPPGLLTQLIYGTGSQNSARSQPDPAGIPNHLCRTLQIPGRLGMLAEVGVRGGDARGDEHAR